MQEITGGTIAYEDGIKAEQEYAPARKARVELTFDVDPTMDAAGRAAVVAGVADFAKAKVYEMLDATPTKTTRGRGKAKDVVASEATLQPEPKPAGKTKADIEAEAIAAMGGAKTAADPAAMDDFTVAPAAEAAKKDPDPAGMDDFTAPAEPVSDADLNKAAQAKRNETDDPVAIRNLIGSYNPEPDKQFTMAQIPQEHRRAFLAKLAALKPKAK